MPPIFQRLLLAFFLISLALDPVAASAQSLAETPEATPVTSPAPPATAPAEKTPAQSQADQSAETEAPLVGWIEINGSLREGPAPPSWMGDTSDAPLATGDLVAMLDHVAQSSRHSGVVLYLDEPVFTRPQIYTVSKAMHRVRDAGKKVLVFAEVYDTNAYLLATSASQILLQNKGLIMLTGLGVEEMYLAGMLEKIGIKADFLQVGDFKGASEQLTRTGPSEAWNENYNALLDDLYTQMIKRIADGRSMTKEQIEAAIADAWAMSDTDYLRRGLVDRLVHRNLFDATEAAFGLDFEWDEDPGAKSAAAVAMPSNPFAIFQTLFQPPQQRTRRDTIALIHAYGAIGSGESTKTSTPTVPFVGPFDSESIGSRTLTRALDDAIDDDNIKGIVLRIDSPGGSAIASEIIWQAVRDAAETKPVYVSLGSLAASGGYYLACAGDRIYLTPETIVGSIGVVGGKLALGGLYEKIGVTTYLRSRGPLGDMFNSTRTFSPEEKEALRAAFQQTYDLFRDRVVAGRGKRLGDIDAVSAGRLFTGRQAITNGMADALGSTQDAIRDLAKKLNLKDGKYDIVDLPPPPTFAEALEDALSPFGVTAPHPPSRARESATLAPYLAPARALLGPNAWRSVAPVLNGLLLLRDEPILTLMPYAIVVR